VSVLADTSVWVEFLRDGRDGAAAALDELLAAGEVVVCGPVVAELLTGTVRRQRAELWQLLSGLEWADLGRAEWRRVGEVAADLRTAGLSVALTDVEIAVAAVTSGARLWSRDADFEQVGGVLDGLERFAP
jgi:predicted nucleic acid-binding protein